MWARMRSDIQAVFDNDPAAKSSIEVFFSYAGLHAIWWYRVGHWWYKRDWIAFSRFLSQVGRWITGIEIHPGAKIGERLFIDHGMGVVIGETCEIGDDVILYQGVTLGGTGKESGKRHPTIGDHVVIGSGAKVLGSFTVGAHTKIGANTVVLQAVPPHCTVVGNPGRIVKRNGVRTNKLDHANMPDPVVEMFEELHQRLAQLESQLNQEPRKRPEQE